MSDPFDPTPGATPGDDVPPPSFPEIDPPGSPEEMPAPGALPDDGLGRPIDGSALGAGDADPD